MSERRGPEIIDLGAALKRREAREAAEAHGWLVADSATEVVVGREHLDTLVDLAQQAIQPWWKDEPRCGYDKAYVAGNEAVAHADAALVEQGDDRG